MLLSAFGCGEGPGLFTASAGQHIRDGQDATDAAGYAPIVSVKLKYSTGDYFACSGTVIAPHLVMTAAHCIESCSTAPQGYGCKQVETAGFGFGRDGLLTKNIISGTMGSQVIGGMDLSGESSPVDWVWFPKQPFACTPPDCSNFNPADPNNPPDIAVLHTTKPLTQLVMPIMPPSTLPTPTNLSNGQAVDIVGFAKYGGGDAGVGERRRKASVSVVATPPSGQTKHRTYTVHGNLVCNGDSGGAGLIYNTTLGRWELAGVLSASNGNCTTTSVGYSFVAYLTYGFLDERCPFGSWSVCAGQADGDHDGVLDSQDNCPDIPNVGQHNCDAEDELLAGETERGDACDPQGCAHAFLVEAVGEVTNNPQLKPVPPFQSPQVPMPKVGFRTRWEGAYIDYRALGFTQDIYGQETGSSLTSNMDVGYCACHNPDASGHTAENPAYYSDTYCKNSVCLDAGRQYPQVSQYKQTGWRRVLWEEADGSSKCNAKDNDSNLWPGSTGYPNDCDDVLQNRAFGRLYGSINGRLAFCTDRDKGNGCQPGDFDKSAKVQGELKSLEWFWLKQDFPHSATTPYDWRKTKKAKVRVRTHPSLFSPDKGNHTGDIQLIELTKESGLGKPHLHPDPDLLFKVPPFWVNPLTQVPQPLPDDVWHLVVLHRDLPEELAAPDFNWELDWQSIGSAGRGLVGTRLDLNQACSF